MSDCRFGVSPVNYPDPDLDSLEEAKPCRDRQTKRHPNFFKMYPLGKTADDVNLIT